MNSLYRFRVKPGIKRELARLNISQNRLGRAIGISSGFMSQVLNGKRFVGPDTRRLLLQHLPSLSFDDLFEEVPSGPGAVE